MEEVIICSCKKLKCPNHGNCVACKSHHSDLHSLPYCERRKLKLQKKELRIKRKEERKLAKKS